MKRDPALVPPDRATATSSTLGLIRFLEQRLHAALHEALSVGDDPRGRYLRQSIGILEGIGDDLIEDPRPVPPETVRLLSRWAADYDTDPEFNPSWLLLG